jgi:hypothetical protein
MACSQSRQSEDDSRKISTTNERRRKSMNPQYPNKDKLDDFKRYNFVHEVRTIRNKDFFDFNKEVNEELYNIFSNGGVVLDVKFQAYSDSAYEDYTEHKDFIYFALITFKQVVVYTEAK